MFVRVLETDADFDGAFTLMHELREHLIAGEFAAAVRAQMVEGYVLAGGFDPHGKLVTLAGYRFARTLFRGPHLFVDDLVTTADARGKGHGTEMLAWLGKLAMNGGLREVWLDSRATAKTFYAKLGFELKSSVPCVIAATRLAGLAAPE